MRKRQEDGSGLVVQNLLREDEPKKPQQIMLATLIANTVMGTMFLMSSSTTPINNGVYKMVLIEPASPVIIKCDTKEEECIISLIEKYAKEFEYSPKLAKAIAYCESNYKETAVGDKGKAYGIYQFHKPTFKMFAKQKGEELDYYNTEDNIKLAIWALANDKEHHWTCHKKVTTKKF